MRTRKKVIRTPTKGKRCNLISVKKGPIARKNRNTKTSTKDIRTTYESPLKHLYKNGPPKLFNSTNTSKDEELQTNFDKDRKKQETPNTRILRRNSNNLIELDQKSKSKNENSQKETMRMITKQTDFLLLSKKRNLKDKIPFDDIPYSKRLKMNKNPLSRINDINEINKFSDSVILIDDTQFQSDIQKVFDKPNMINSEPKSSYINNKPLIKNDEIVVIDGDSSFLRVDTSPSTLNKSIKLPTSSELKDSIIIIDPDDESPAPTTCTTPKVNEDCLVVWSSLPKNCNPYNTRNLNSPDNKSSKISKNNKYFIHTQADLTNLRYLNNENNNTSKYIPKKSPKKRVKKPLPKTPSVKTKVGGKSTTETRVTMKSTLKSASKVTRKSIASKISAKANTTKVKRKAKNNGELIFLSESRDENETPKKTTKLKNDQLREIVIDGTNVAMAYTKNKTFSEKGIKLLIDYFTKKGHIVKVFIPQHKRSIRFPLLEKWHSEGIVIFTPSRKLGNKSFTPYDDRYILEYATACNGIVVSQDQFRDLYAEKPQYRDTIENRLLVPTFVGEYVMFPEDPLGRHGPTLTNFLKH